MVAKRIKDWVRNVIGIFGPRQAGLKYVADYIYREVLPFGDFTTKHVFKFSPGAFLGYLKVTTPIILLSATLLLLGHPVLATIGWAVFAVIVLSEFVFYKKLLDPIFPKEHGVNVLSLLLPKGNPKKRVLVCGHHDSAQVFRYLTWNSYFYLAVMGLYTLTFFAGLILLPLSFLFNLTTALTILAITTLIVHPFFFFFVKKGYTPGAGDNLISVAIALEVFKYFSKHRPNSVEVGFVSFDAEECGLRGSKAFVEALGNNGSYATVPTLVINMDSFYKLKDLSVCKSDLNGTVRTDAELTNKVFELGKKYGMKKFSFPLGAGATDGASFIQAGYRTTTLLGIGVNPKEEVIYHTEKDTVDKIDDEIVDAVFCIVRDLIKNEDIEG